jgi:hypothetical protein
VVRLGFDSHHPLQTLSGQALPRNMAIARSTVGRSSGAMRNSPVTARTVTDARASNRLLIVQSAGDFQSAAERRSMQAQR